MNKPEYGTREYYKEVFADYLADINSDTPKITYSIVRGFL